MKKIFLLLTALSCSLFLSAQLNIDFLGQLTYGDQLSNLTGWADGAGHEYAIVGTYDGTSIVDITDPTDPVEVQFVNGNNSIWREVSTWDHYAYVVTEAGGGLLCIDLSGLPGSVDFNFSDSGMGLSSGHTVFADENGIVHVFGSNKASGGDFMLDANVDPMDPEYVGQVDDWYVHDGFVRGDTLWAGNIYNGQFSVWDLSDKSSPELLATQTTPFSFTHNCWLSDDGNYLFTTDEVSNATVASYDVSDLSDIKLLDEFRAEPGSNSIPHNTYVLGEFLVTACYRDGVVITDAKYPDILIKTGQYDTSPLSGDGFNGAWGCWAFLPSGNIIVSDMEEGLFILGPHYVHACYVSGNITDAASGSDIIGASVDITLDPDAAASSDLTGYYATGTLNEGSYDITFSKTGYVSKTITGVSLISGIMVDLDVELEPLASTSVTAHVVNSCSGEGIAGAAVLFVSDGISNSLVADASGNISLSALDGYVYDVYASKWGFMTKVATGEELSSSGGVTITLDPGYYDDFISDLGWTVTGTSTTGQWTMGEPVGTELDGDQCNPDFDADGDFGANAYVTGNGGGEAGTDDVDDGTTNLYSPVFSLLGYSDPVISYDRWFFNGGGTGTPDDELVISISNGSSTVELETLDHTDSGSEWEHAEFNVTDYITLSANMQLIVTTGDDAASGHIVEAGLDKFMISAPDPLATSATAGAGTATVTITGGSEPYHILWDDASAQTTETATGLAAGTYTVTVTDNNGCTSEATVTVQDVAVNEIFAGMTTDIYPTPFENIIHADVQLTTNFSSMYFIAEDITGKTIAEQKIQNGENTITGLSKIAAGVYAVKIIVDGNIAFTQNIIKQ